eukprot:11057596-Ditylum_brightwellii.AAC.1
MERYPFRFFHPPGQRRSSGSALLSRYPIRDVVVVDLPRCGVDGSVFPALVCVVSFIPSCTTSGQQQQQQQQQRGGVNLRVANVHLRPPLELDGKAFLSTERTTGSVRRAEIKELLSQIHCSINTTIDPSSSQQQEQQSPTSSLLDIVAGDFNEDDGRDGLSHLCQKAGLKDALAEFVPRHQETHRWPFHY